MFRLARAISSFFLVAALAAHAQITTSRIDVRVTGARCGELKQVFLIIDGDDLEDRWIRLDPAGSCRWTTDLGESSSLSTALSRFSLRVDSARTDCHRAAGNEEKLVAELEFACCRQDVLRNVRVTTDPPMPVRYLRDVRPFPESRTGAVRCVEEGMFAGGTGTIRHTQFVGEDVHLLLGARTPKQAISGLLLDDVVVDDGAVVLTRDGIVYRLAVQRAKGKSRTAPTLSPNAISIDIKKLGDLQLRSAEIEVLK